MESHMVIVKCPIQTTNLYGKFARRGHMIRLCALPHTYQSWHDITTEVPDVPIRLEAANLLGVPKPPFTYGKSTYCTGLFTTGGLVYFVCSTRVPSTCTSTVFSPHHRRRTAPRFPLPEHSTQSHSLWLCQHTFISEVTNTKETSFCYFAYATANECCVQPPQG